MREYTLILAEKNEATMRIVKALDDNEMPIKLKSSTEKEIM